LDGHLHNGPVEERYAALIAAGEIEDDPSQRVLVKRLDALAAKLARRASARRPGLARLLPWRAARPEPLRGLYVHGPVGRGKTMLMDLFFEAVPLAQKRRAHFHEFMLDVHERVFAFRSALKRGEIKGEDPIAPLASGIAAEAQLLCFDEFSVTAVADAMNLARLFSRLFAQGVVVVATSNAAPDDLYRDGLNRALFLPFIELLKEKTDVITLGARTDFRLEKLTGAPVYLAPLSDEADRLIDQAWLRLAGGGESEAVLEVKGRRLRVPRAARGSARFSFAQLCEAPLSASDYLKIAHSFHTIFIDHIPQLGAEMRNPAKRFINLIDILYDHRVKLVASAAVPPDQLYRGGRTSESFEFARTASRLVEMQGSEYLGRAHGEPTEPLPLDEQG